MSEEQEIEEFELGDLAWGVNPQTEEIGIWNEPYVIQVVDDENGQWILTYYPPKLEFTPTITVHLARRKKSTQRLDEIFPMLRELLGKAVKKRQRPDLKKSTAEVEEEIKNAMKSLPLDERGNITRVAWEMNKDPAYLRKLFRKHWPGIEPQKTIKWIAERVGNEVGRY